MLEESLSRVALVTGEDLVAAVTAEKRVDTVALCELGAIERRDRGRVTERLVVGERELRCRGEDVVGGDGVLVMVGSEVLHGDLRVAALVVTGYIEPNRIRPGGLAGELADEPGDGRAVGAAAQERAYLAVSGVEAVLHRVTGSTAIFVRERFFVGGRAFVAVTRCPIAFVGDVTGAHNHQLARLKLAPPTIDRAWTRDHVKVDVVEHRLWIDFCLDVVMRAKRRRGRSEDGAGGRRTDDERVRPDAVDGEQHLIALAVQDREREVAGQITQERRSRREVRFGELLAAGIAGPYVGGADPGERAPGVVIEPRALSSRGHRRECASGLDPERRARITGLAEQCRNRAQLCLGVLLPAPAEPPADAGHRLRALVSGARRGRSEPRSPSRNRDSSLMLPPALRACPRNCPSCDARSPSDIGSRRCRAAPLRLLVGG